MFFFFKQTFAKKLFAELMRNVEPIIMWDHAYAEMVTKVILTMELLAADLNRSLVLSMLTVLLTLTATETFADVSFIVLKKKDPPK